MSMKQITLTYHINEKDGKVVKITDGNDNPGTPASPQNANVTDTTAAVVAHNSPSCIYVPIGGTWFCFC